MAYRDDQHLDRSAYGTTLLSVLLCLAGWWLATQNPQFYSRDDLQQAHAFGVSGTNIPAQFRDPRVRLGGVLMSVMGLGGICLGATMATGDPKTLAPASVDVVGDGQDLEPDTKKGDAIDLVTECRDVLGSFLADNRVLNAAIAARCLLVHGDQGAGKSLLSHQLCTWRQIRRGDTVIVANPHYHHDKQNGLYNTADVVLGTAEEIRQQLPKIIAEALATPRKVEGQETKQRVSIVLEEFSNWHTSLYHLGAVAEQVIFSASQDLRKSILNFIIPVHGLKKGMLGGEAMDSGRTARLLDQSVVLSLDVDDSLDDDDDDPTWTGRGEASPRGAAYEGGKRVKFQLPALLGPNHYPQQFAPYFTAAVNALRPSASIKRTAAEQLMDAVERWEDTTPANTDIADGWVEDTPFVAATAGAILNGNRDDWCALFDLPHASAFCTWLIKRQFMDGHQLPVSKIRDDWGKHHLDTTDDLIKFLAAVNAYGLGVFDYPTSPKHWTLKVAYTTIPDPASFPTPVEVL